MDVWLKFRSSRSTGGLGLVVAILLCLAAASAVAVVPSPAQAMLSSIKSDRATLAAEVFSSMKSDAPAEIIVTLAQPDPVPQNAEKDNARSSREFRERNRAAAGKVLARLSASDFTERHTFDNFAGFTGTVSRGGLQKLLADPSVKYVEPVRILEPHLAQGIPLMNAAGVRSSHNGGGLAIAICDTGVNYTHPRLGNGPFPNDKVIGGYDFGDNDADPRPGTAHGTACAGIAAGELGTEGDYIGGVACNAKLYALKIMAGSSGVATSAAMISAWDWCMTHQNDHPDYPIMVISTSFGSGRHYSAEEGDAASPGMTSATNAAVAAGITVLASAGNNGHCDSMTWPASISSVISVGAVYDADIGTVSQCVMADSCAPRTDTPCTKPGYYAVPEETVADKVIAYSNTAPFLTLLAPSQNCCTTDIKGAGGYLSGDYTDTFYGTSAATAYAAGAVACLQSAAKALLHRYLAVAEVRSMLTSTGVGITDSRAAITKPRVDLGAAVTALSTMGAGSLKVTLLPAQAVSEGARWRVDGGDWQNSDALVSNLPVGDHAVAFETIPDWLTPTDQSVRVTDGDTATTTTTYISTVTIVPAVAGRTQADAAAAMADAGLVAGAITQAYSGTIAADRVVSQDPGAGTRAALGAAVALIISKGAPPVPLAGIPALAALAAMTALGCASFIRRRK